jgi:hypothetical protein
MTSNSTIVPLRQPDEIDDPLTAVLRSGARRLLAQAIEAEAEAFLARFADCKLADGRDRVVRHGYGPERTIQTGIGPVEVRRVKLRDRGATNPAERLSFTSTILPRWARRTRSLDALLPVLYLRGVSTGDFQEALAALLGKDASNLSPAVIARLKGEWEADYRRWQQRDLSARHYVYVWADGVYLQARMEPQAECMLVVIGATPEGKKELVGFQVGQRESAQSWRELLVDVKARGLTIGQVRAEIRAGGPVPAEGPRGATDVLRRPGRSLGSPAHLQSDRERVRHGSAPDGAEQGRARPGHGAADGLQARDGRRQDVAAAQGRKSIAAGDPGRHIQGRH